MRSSSIRELTNGFGHYTKVSPSHIANDEQIRELFPPRISVRYYPETLIIEEGVGVFIGVISCDDTMAEMFPVPLSKLLFSEEQFRELLDTNRDVYNYYRNLVAEILGLGSRQLKSGFIHRQLKKCSVSAQTACLCFSDQDVDVLEEL